MYDILQDGIFSINFFVRMFYNFFIKNNKNLLTAKSNEPNIAWVGVSPKHSEILLAAHWDNPLYPATEKQLGSDLRVGQTSTVDIQMLHFSPLLCGPCKLHASRSCWCWRPRHGAERVSASEYGLQDDEFESRPRIWTKVNSAFYHSVAIHANGLACCGWSLGYCTRHLAAQDLKTSGDEYRRISDKLRMSTSASAT